MNVIKEITKINELELSKGITGTSASWHEKYVTSSWCYVGNLPTALTEGDIICVCSQYGEIEDFHMPRDESTGRSKAFAFLKYEDFRSAVLAVDNLTGTMILGKTIRVDHTDNYRPPKEKEEEEGKEEEKASKEAEMDAIYGGGGSKKTEEKPKKTFGLDKGVDLFKKPGEDSSSGSEDDGSEDLDNDRFGGGGYALLDEGEDDMGEGEKEKKGKKERKKSKESKKKHKKEKNDKKSDKKSKSVKSERKRGRADGDTSSKKHKK